MTTRRRSKTTKTVPKISTSLQDPFEMTEQETKIFFGTPIIRNEVVLEDF
jgi:hypothetical protein